MIEERLSDDIEAGAKMRPRFSTDIVRTDGGFEVRNSRWAVPLHQFEFNLMPGTPDDAETLNSLLDMFYAAGGSFETFLFRPWNDWYIGGQSLAALGGGQYQLQRTYSAGAVTRTRTVTRPVVDETFKVYVGGVLQEDGYTVDPETGIIEFDSPPGGAVTADFGYDVVVRFEDDEVEILAHSRHLDQPVSIVLLEVREG